MKLPHEISSCDELLAAWDDGEIVTTVEMGGIGPGYEQCIQIVTMEVLRVLLASRPTLDRWDEPGVQEMTDSAIFKSDACKSLGLSGAQVGAAKSLAGAFYKNGYRESLDSVEADRRIMTSKNPMPGSAQSA